MRPVLLLHAVGTLAAAPGAASQVLLNVLLSIVNNPVKALPEANYIGILAWAIALGTCPRRCC